MNHDDSRFAVKQIQGEIRNLFKDLIDLSDLDGTRIDKDVAMLSRGLSAYSLHLLADISPNEAAQSVVDGSGDNGIDAIFWHKNNNVLWLVQSKWIQKGSGQPDYPGVNAFATGVRNLINDSLDRPNDKIEQKREEIEEALSTIGVKVKLIITHTGQGLAKTSRTCLENVVKDLNENDEGAFGYEVFDKDRAYQTAVENANKLNIEAEFNLSNWGKIDDPYTAFYGQISALDLAMLWAEHKNKLFAKNLRDFIGKTQANEEIIQTIKEEPTLFWYFNNGVTVLCEELQKKTKGTKRLSDNFFARGISVINGAQTIGSLGRAYEENPEELEEKLEQAEVFIRLISLEKCPDDFGIKTTRATNTQNTVESRDFVALDPTQQRLAQELKAWDSSKTYFYKRSVEMVSTDNTCTLTEVTLALACYHPNLELAVIAKRDTFAIWLDTSSTLYKSLFNNNVSAVQLWRTLEIYRIAKKALVSQAKKSKLLDKISIHGDLFVMHLIFHFVKRQSINIFSSDFKAQDYDLFLPKIIDGTVSAVHEYMDKETTSTRLGLFFKNYKKCQDLKQKIESTYPF